MSITTRSMTIALLSAATMLAMPGRADHIPGHNDGDPVFPVPIPGQEHFSGGIMFVTAIGPNGGSHVHNARFDITFVSDGATPAEELLIVVGMFIEEESGEIVHVETEVSGADLGFGSGAGTFHGTFETDALNGVAVESFLLPPYSIVDLDVGATTGGIDGTGYFVDSFIYFDLTDGEGCVADVDRNGGVDVDDIVAVILAWGECKNPDDCAADVDKSGIVDVDDLVAVILAQGDC
ncbi:MAG: hypothetical protein ACYTJ0_00480 [Planctomycetota bacterium]|jgi:hypothetical protein